METSERLEFLETSLAELKAMNQTISLQLEELRNQHTSQPPPSREKVPSEPSRTPNNPPTLSPITPGPKETKLKPCLPSEFNGDRKKGRAFLNSCELYMRLAPHHFEDEITAIHWAMSFMKEGRASLFAQRIIRTQTETRKSFFVDWDHFREVFISEFCPKNETQLALAKLESSEYFQGRKSVDDYVDDFKDLIAQAGYKEGLAIVVKFRRGLRRDIQDQIAQMTAGRPSDDHPEEWYQAAITSDENRMANALFHGASKTPVIRQGHNPFTSPSPWPRTSTFPTPVAPRPNPRSDPVPMDIDAVRKRKTAPDTCRRCGQTGHWANECPKRFDIRYMSMDEKQGWLNDVALEIDRCKIEEKEEEEEEEGQESETPKDFRAGSE